MVFFDSGRNVKRSYDVSHAFDGTLQLRLNSAEVLPVAQDKIYITGGPGRNMYAPNAPLPPNLLLTINREDGAQRLSVAYPSLFQKAKWGDFFHRYYSTYNNYTDEMIFSFPPDHNLVVVSPQGQVREVYAGSVFTERLRPFMFTKESRPKKKDAEGINFLGQRTYRNIYFDRFANLYYRVVSNSIPEEEYKNRSSNSKKSPFSIIILNSNFQKVGEQSFDANMYSSASIFISKDGLCLPTAESNDDKMVFDVFAPNKKQSK